MEEKLGQNKGLNVTCGKWTARLGLQKEIQITFYMINLIFLVTVAAASVAYIESSPVTERCTVTIKVK